MHLIQVIQWFYQYTSHSLLDEFKNKVTFKVKIKFIQVKVGPLYICMKYHNYSITLEVTSISKVQFITFLSFVFGIISYVLSLCKKKKEKIAALSYIK